MPVSEPLFVTGGSGFVGRHLVQSLAENEFENVTFLVRDPATLSPVVRGRAGWRTIVGDLREPAGWCGELPVDGTVLHMASATGKIRVEESQAVNVEGTRGLVRASKDRGVSRLVLLSSIAARFPDAGCYPYAASKAAAERAVTTSELDWAILRPTQVLGPGSQIMEGLARLASPPVGLLFGSGRVRLQPIHVLDLARQIVMLLTRQPLGGVSLEIGGPEALPVAELLQRIRVRVRGRKGPWVRIPLRPTRWILGRLEPLLFPIVPITAGQLAAFAEHNDGSAQPSSAGAGVLLAPPTRTIEDMVNEWAT